MRVALVVDNPRRDLPGLVLLALYLCRQGVTCYLVPMYFISWKGRELGPLAPDFVLFNYLRANNEHEVRNLLEASIPAGVLDTEGITPGVIEDYDRLHMARDPEVRRRVSCYFTWGTKVAERARREGWYRDDQLLVTGTPRFDFYARPWREAALRLSRYADAYPRPLVLINGSFPKGNPRFQTCEEEERQLVEIFGFDRDVASSWVKLDQQALIGMAALANRLAARFPGTTFIYRPHPFEKPETYHELLEKRDNLHLTGEGTVDGWILRASAVIQRSCTTALEAALAGVPTLWPVWLPNSPASAIPPGEDVSLRLESEEQLFETLAPILAEKFEPPAPIRRRVEEVIGEWLCGNDGQAAERVARVVLEKLSAAGGRPDLRRCRDLAYGLNGRASSWKRRARAAVAEALGLSVHWSFRRWRRVTDDLSWWPQSGKYFDARQVQELVDAIRACNGDTLRCPPPEVGVLPAREGDDYHFGYRQGVSVKVFPK
jgi:surface carbohydrate biosynthesis protein